MELSKDEKIFQIIDKQFDLLETTNEWMINILNGNTTWTENEFNNFISVMKSIGYKEIIEDDYLEISSNDDILKINKLSNIIKYCYNENYKELSYEWLKTNIVNIEKINDLFDANIEMSIIKNKINIEPDNWNDIRKIYKIVKKIIYVDEKNNISYIAKLVKDNGDNDYYSLKQSKVLNSTQKYEFSIIINKKESVIQSIVKIIQSILLSNIILTKPQQKEILTEYSELIKKDMKINKWNKDKDSIPLLTPKPITLERSNLIDPNEYGAISILNGYTVTEKADGERLLLYINNKGNCYLINSSYRVEDSGIIAKNNKIFNSLIDGEFISCNKRKDNIYQNIYAAFDIYYINNKKITDLPLISTNKKSRYEELKSITDNLDLSIGLTEFIVKTHYYSDNIFNDNKKILENAKSYPYEIDGLIFTPANLALYSYYPSKVVELTENMKWDRVFKWKPEEQNTIDFLIKEEKDVLIKGLKHREISLWVGYNKIQWEEINPDKGLRLRYDRDYAKSNKYESNIYIPKLFKPIQHYHSNVDKCYVLINSKNEIRAENGDKIEDKSIVEFRYDVSAKLWYPIRVREDKTRIYKKGILSKTANDLSVALNIWRSIHSPVTMGMIIGNKEVFTKEAADNIEDRLLDTDDIYYSREIPRDSLLSVNMLNFHNQGIKQELYKKASVKGSLLELCCGEGGDMNRILAEKYKFILGIDLVRNNIVNPRSGAYSRMLKRKNQYSKQIEGQDRVFFPDMVFCVGDCSTDIKSGKSSSIIKDEESEKILKIVMNKQKSVLPHLKYIAGRGLDNFNCVSCMFAIHYFFENKTKLEGFLNNVSSNLKKGGVFICTFMDGKTVEDSIISNGGDMVEGRKIIDEDKKYNVPVWCIIRRYNKDLIEDEEDSTKYNKKVDVFLENTQKLIPEFLVNYDFLIKKAKEFGLNIKESEMFSESFNKIKETIPDDDTLKTHLHTDIIELDKDPIQKQFSFFNRWCVFEKV